MSQTDGQAALRVCINEQNFLSLLCQGDAQVDAGGGFANAAFLVDDGDDLCVHFSRYSFQFLFQNRGRKAMFCIELADDVLPFTGCSIHHFFFPFSCAVCSVESRGVEYGHSLKTQERFVQKGR